MGQVFLVPVQEFKTKDSLIIRYKPDLKKKITLSIPKPKYKWYLEDLLLVMNHVTTYSRAETESE